MNTISQARPWSLKSINQKAQFVLTAAMSYFQPGIPRGTTELFSWNSQIKCYFSLRVI